MDDVRYEGLTSLEAAKRLGVTPQQVYEMLFAGEIEGGPDVHGQVRFPEAEIERLVTEKLPAS